MQANSLERIQQYLEIEHEPEPTPEGTPPAYWPASGKLSVEKLSAKYSTDGPKVLHELNFDISSGERVGIGKYLPCQHPSSLSEVTFHSWPYRKWKGQCRVKWSYLLRLPGIPSELSHLGVAAVHPH